MDVVGGLSRWPAWGTWGSRGRDQEWTDTIGEVPGLTIGVDNVARKMTAAGDQSGGWALWAWSVGARPGLEAGKTDLLNN